MSEVEEKSQSAFDDTVHAVQGLGVLALTYNWLAESANLVTGLLSPEKGDLLPLLFRFPLEPGHLFPFLWPFLYCVLVGFITYILIIKVCELKWVKRKYVVADCIQFNPFGLIFCFIKIICVWFLVWICRYLIYIICIPIWICFFVWIWRFFVG